MRLRLPSPLVELADERVAGAGLRVLLKRDDLIHPAFPGNKWRKLKYHLAAATAAGHDTLLTFGGAYSNHLRATAAAGHYFGFSTVGVVRGEEHSPLNPVLAAAAGHGMTLTYVDRARYRAKTSPEFAAQLRREFGDFYLVPEGGAGAPGVQGCSEIVGEIGEPFDVLCCAVGTGTTLAGVSRSLASGQRAVGFSVLKGGGLPEECVGDWSVETEFHFGGFAKRNPELDAFVDDFRERHGITLDWVYEGKMMYGLFQLAQRGDFPPGTTLVALLA